MIGEEVSLLFFRGTERIPSPLPLQSNRHQITRRFPVRINVGVIQLKQLVQFRKTCGSILRGNTRGCWDELILLVLLTHREYLKENMFHSRCHQHVK